MRTYSSLPRPKRILGGETDLYTELTSRVVGQPGALDAIIPCIHMYQAGLSPEGRPAGIYLLLGPSGTGKTRTVESLAEALHGTQKAVLKVDCGEYQMEHEVAKLIGAPPGYLGHKETQPMFTQARMNAVTSENCSLSIVLFDEIEKAAPSMIRLLLGVLDKAILRLGDNTTVNFERSMIFMTSNLGAREMLREISPDFGFDALGGGPPQDLDRKLEKIGLSAVRRKFPPEFVNRLDGVVTYLPLDAEALHAILDSQLLELQQMVDRRLGQAAFRLDLSDESRKFLLENGTSAQYGARELKRTIHRHLIQPIASMLVTGAIEPGTVVAVDRDPENGLSITATRTPAPKGRRLRAA